MGLKAIMPANGAKPSGLYSPGVDAGNIVFVAGQVGRDPQTGQLAEGLEAQAEQVMKHIGAILDAAGLSFANVAKTTCLLANIEDYDAFNAVYLKFVMDPRPARATYAVKALPGGALIEVEAFAVRD